MMGMFSIVVFWGIVAVIVLWHCLGGTLVVASRFDFRLRVMMAMRIMVIFAMGRVMRTFTVARFRMMGNGVMIFISMPSVSTVQKTKCDRDNANDYENDGDNA